MARRDGDATEESSAKQNLVGLRGAGSWHSLSLPSNGRLADVERKDSKSLGLIGNAPAPECSVVVKC
jgi:hypothetical protein